MTALDDQTIAFAFTATDDFDGSTEAPEVGGPDEQSQFYQGVAQEIGLFPVNDPSLEEDFGTSRGNRWVTWLEIRLDAPAPPGSRLEVVDNTSIPGTPVVLKEIRDYTGESLVYIEAGFLVPQGAVLRLTGGSGVLRYHVTFMTPQGLGLAASLVLAAQNGGGGGGGGGQCPAYVVSQDGNCPYSSINGAIAAALADGRGPDSPAVVLVQPGIYSEAVALQSGISIECRPGARRGGVFLLGSLNYAAGGPSDGNSVAVVGMIVFPESGSALTFSGDFEQELNVANCLLVGAGPEPTVVNSNTVEDSELLAQYVDVAQFTPGVLVYEGTGAAASDFSNYILFKNDSAETAVSVGAEGELICSDGTIVGQLIAADDANVVVFNSVIESSGQPGVMTASTQGVFAFYTAIAVDGPTPFAVDGAGGFGYAALTLPGVKDLAPTLNAGGGAAANDLYFQNGPNLRTVFASDAVRTDDNVLLVDTSAGDVTLTLRLAANYRPGKPITIKKISADMNSVILVTTGGQLFDGIATGFQTEIYRESLTFASDGISGFWLVSEGLQQFDLVLPMFTEESLVAPITSYYGGFYIFGATDNAGAPVALGAASQPTGAFAFIVLGSIPAGAETVTLTGTSVDDNGVRTPGDAEVLAVPGGSAVDTLFQSTKRWVGPVTFTPTGGLVFNYGFVAFQSEGDTNFTVRFVDASWQVRGTASTASGDVALIHHRASGWTFVGGGPPVPPPPIASLAADYAPDNTFTPGEYGSWRRDNIGTVVLGNDEEGVFLRVVGSSQIFGSATIRIEQ